MISYELAKALKDAGFPQIGRSHDFENNGRIESLRTPSLEELIEACGHNIESIIQRGNGNDDNWEARSKTQRFNATTLKEAVARLWIALNKKV